MDEAAHALTRRNFLSTVTKSVALLPLASAYAQAAALTSPKWPEAPKSPDSASGKPIETPPLHAPTEQAAGGKAPYLPHDQRVGYAVVGLGKLAVEEIMPAILQSKMCKITALVSGHKEKAMKLAQEYGVPEASVYNYETFDQLKNNPAVQVIYIVLPNSMHKEFVLRGAKTGKHILCEKPMATSAADAREMVATCKQANVNLMIAYRQQYEPNNRWLRSMVREKTFGKVKLFEANNSQNQDGQKGGKQQWRHIKALAGGGALPDIGLYCLNAARFISGEEPYEVMAYDYSTPNDPRFKEVEETIAFTLKFPSGLLAQCTASYGAHETKRFRFTAENGWFGMEPAFAYHGLKTEVSYAMGAPVEHHEYPTLPEQNQFALEMDHMADCILNKKRPHTPGEEGVQDHVIMDAIYESVRNKKPVTLERFEKLDVFRNDSLS